LRLPPGRLSYSLLAPGHGGARDGELRVRADQGAYEIDLHVTATVRIRVGDEMPDVEGVTFLSRDGFEIPILSRGRRGKITVEGMQAPEGAGVRNVLPSGVGAARPLARAGRELVYELEGSGPARVKVFFEGHPHWFEIDLRAGSEAVLDLTAR